MSLVRSFVFRRSNTPARIWAQIVVVFTATVALLSWKSSHGVGQLGDFVCEQRCNEVYVRFFAEHYRGSRAGNVQNRDSDDE